MILNKAKFTPVRSAALFKDINVEIILSSCSNLTSRQPEMILSTKDFPTESEETHLLAFPDAIHIAQGLVLVHFRFFIRHSAHGFEVYCPLFDLACFLVATTFKDSSNGK
mmetsp:Transcript_44162/g.139320  ORF Transcript_44162/g.139320 Transcript_44162/m.139320 type:complete len:110 (-) Transcript_44162:742-1071(-)